MKRSLFITFEGGEGAGKTTQIKRLAHALPNSVMTREPGGTPEGEALRTLFIEQRGQNWPAQAQLLLMFSVRVLHTQNFIQPSLAQGKTVLCDRYTDSTRVYQGYAGGMELPAIEAVKKASIGDFEPDITFILDINAEEGLIRAAGRNSADTFEEKDISFHKRIREGFLTIAKENQSRCVVIDATLSEDTIADQIMTEVHKRLTSSLSSSGLTGGFMDFPIKSENDKGV